MSNTIRVIQYGLGPIGSAMARHVVEREGLELVGGVDIDPAKVGRDVGEVIDLGHPLGFAVAEKLAQVKAEADVVLHTTSSYFDQFKDQIIEILEAGLDIVSTAEELSFPWLAHPQEAAEVDAVARRVGKTVLGTGVNPGFIMDTLPLSLTAICQRVDHISVTRVINASTRRGPFQAKIGSGLTVDEFKARMAAGRMGHVGLPESMGMVFHTLGKELTRYEASVVVRGDDASMDDVYHRWCQIYLPGIGWMPVDPSGGDQEWPADQARYFGGLANRFLITTHGGGDSKELGWDYNAHATWTFQGQGVVHEEGYGVWSPVAEEDGK